MTSANTDTDATDRAGVLELNERLRSAWNAHDAVAFGEPWEDDADHVNIFGDVQIGREQITAGAGFIFSSMMSQTESNVIVRALRIIGDGLALLDLDQSLTGVTDGPAGPLPWVVNGKLETRIKIVAKRRKDGWTVASFQNTAVIQRSQTRK
jgi:uncharacterized protein (TIGR02246 family)